jgi:hypothetical protein
MAEALSHKVVGHCAPVLREELVEPGGVEPPTS